MQFRQFVDDDLGCASYLIGDESSGEAVVVDPAYAIEPYLEEADKRHVRITRVLARRSLAITPNHVTIVAIVVGLVACGLASIGAYAHVALAGVLLQVNSILDSVDGELARLRYQYSKLGQWLDKPPADPVDRAVVKPREAPIEGEGGLVALFGSSRWRNVVVQAEIETFAIDPDGTVAWRVAHSDVVTAAELVGGRLVLTGFDGQVNALDPATGRQG